MIDVMLSSRSTAIPPEDLTTLMKIWDANKFTLHLWRLSSRSLLLCNVTRFCDVSANKGEDVIKRFT